MAGWWMTASSLTIPKHSLCGRPFAQGQGKNFVCPCVCGVWAISVSIFFTLTDRWHCALSCMIWHLAGGSILYTWCIGVSGCRKEISVLAGYFLCSDQNAVGNTTLTHERLARDLSLLCPLKLMRCISDQKITPQNSDDESLQRCTEDGGGREGGLLPPTPSLVQSLGPQRVSWLRLFLLFSCLGFWLSYSLRCLSSLNLFFPLFLPHPLFIPPYPVLGLSHGVNLWLWSSRNIGMATHALLCFVSFSLLAGSLTVSMCSCVCTVPYIRCLFLFRA